MSSDPQVQEAIKSLAGMIEGLELSIELEEVVMKHLQPDFDHALAQDTQNYNFRRISQYCTSRDQVRTWKKELATLAVSLNELKKISI